MQIVLRFDVILIQEIRDASGKAILKLLSLINKYVLRVSWYRFSFRYVVRRTQLYVILIVIIKITSTFLSLTVYIFAFHRNSTKGIYDITISPRLGRSSSKEQYAFLFRSVQRQFTYSATLHSLTGLLWGGSFTGTAMSCCQDFNEICTLACLNPESLPFFFFKHYWRNRLIPVRFP